ncbi:MAG TPA: hypothetical protein VMW75_26675, partial [Thermoanaerobaculia bacterium]|nr:hypothetical protein [Thermoanaerobaculia bacterium]
TAADHILRLYHDTELRMRLAEAGRDLVTRRYDWKNIYRSFVDSCLNATSGHAQWVAANRGISSAA